MYTDSIMSRKRKLSIIYDGDGIITKTAKTYRGKPFFRKLFYYSTPPKPVELQRVLAETSIVRTLMEHPHPNIVSYYRINDQYVDMEKVGMIPIETPLHSVLSDMIQVKDFLQGLGIMYMDWKLDNIGKKGKRYKLYDFDSSGTVVHGKWNIKPVPHWSFDKALELGITDPYEMDNWSFQHCFKENAT